MLQGIPAIVSIGFVLITLGTFYMLLLAAKGVKPVFFGMLLWLVFQACLGGLGFYLDSYSMPPRFPVMILPPIIFLLYLFLSKRGKAWVRFLDIRALTLLHVVRFFIEIFLYILAESGAIPQLMTFEGRNFDILIGATALPVYYFCFIRQSWGPRVLLIWNLAGLALVLNIAIHGLLSAPTPLQQLAFDEPNRAIFYFPYTWLPSFIVPAVVMAHIAAIRYALRAETAYRLVTSRA